MKSFSYFRSWKPADLVPKETHIAHWSLLYHYALSVYDIEPSEVFSLFREAWPVTFQTAGISMVPGNVSASSIYKGNKEFDVISTHARRDWIHLRCFLRPGSLWLEAGDREEDGRACGMVKIFFFLLLACCSFEQTCFWLMQLPVIKMARILRIFTVTWRRLRGLGLEPTCGGPGSLMMPVPWQGRGAGI